eukprot:scaffold2385_cov178-Amphora_coffeaeformis.AAC.5
MNNNNKENVYETHRMQLKCLVLGAAGAGKTSILRRYFYHTFEAGTRVPTRGSDFYVGKLTETLEVVAEDGEEGDCSVCHPNDEDNQLLRWYADLQETAPDMAILIVGNKLDRAISPQDSNNNGAVGQSRRSRVAQRDVLGLVGKGFRGQDFQYEYRVSPIERKSNTTTTTPSKTQRAEVSSFLANRENWTADNSYLDSLLNSEDESHPDRDMVLLWCLRNELTHLEVSAATGQGVNEAVTTLARMAMSRKLEAEYEQQQQQMQELDQEEEEAAVTQDAEPPQSTAVPAEEETTMIITDSSPVSSEHPSNVVSLLQEWFRPNKNNHNRRGASSTATMPRCCFGIPPPTHWFGGLHHKHQQQLLIVNDKDASS